MLTQRGTRGQVERRADRQERLEKAQERRFVKNLEDARDTLDSVIERAVMGDNRAFDALEQFSEEMNAVYSQARLMDRDER